MNEVQKRSLFIVPAGDMFLFCSPLNNVYALVNSAAVKVLSEKCKDNNCRSDFPEMEPLFDMISRPETNSPFNTVRLLDPVFLGIIPSRRCSMGCVYCDFGASEGPFKIMDPAICVAAIDYYFDKIISDGKNNCQIQFFGGEPFIEDDIVDIAVHHARMLSARTGVHVEFQASTNGYYSESRARWIGEYIDTTVLSLDGFREYHDRNRPVGHNRGSFDEVVRTARILSQSPTDLCIRCCITSDSVNAMEDIALWFCKEFNPSIITFETLQENRYSIDAGLQPPDPVAFANHFFQASKIIKEYGIEPVFAAVSGKTPRYTFCPVGKDALICGPDMKINSCYLQEQDWKKRGLDLTLGEISASGKVDVWQDAVERIRGYLTDKPGCINCFCRYHCAGGCHVHNSYPGSLTKRNDFCRQTRIISVFNYLSLLGKEDVVDQLVSNTESLTAIAENTNDSLFDWQYNLEV